ncbi:MAG TPA: caspase family protein [Stellaceae bacterium]|jgi:hypothetical protein|nr:caspase family protein [Stellaceae bacterium]
MKRSALIISNPGRDDEENYCRGVGRDAVNFQEFLMSPIGGLWRSDEIKNLWRPSKKHVKEAIQEHSEAQYSATIFCGHGHHSRRTDSTIVELRPGVDMDSDDLRVGARRHTLILDCCRVIAPPQPTVAMDEAVIAKKADTINPSDCRSYYDVRVGQCAPGVIVAFACCPGETAGDDDLRGGYYSYNLINAATAWKNQEIGNVDTRVWTQSDQ